MIGTVSRRQGLSVLLALFVLLGWAAPAGATDDVVLTVVGKDGAVARFTMAQMEALPQESFVTATPWYEGRKRFSGPRLSAVLDAAGIDATGDDLGADIQLIAINDYKATLPLKMAQDERVIVATRLDGAPMSVRDKGPLFVIFPFDDSADLRNAAHYARSVWQLTRIVVQ